MTIPVLRGLTEETSNLPNLGKSLADLLSGGNSEIQNKLREAIAQDPSVAENLADLSRNNPELFGALKLGKFGDAIAKTPAGYKQKREEQSLQAGALDIKAKQEESDLAPVRASILNMQNEKLKLDSQNAQEAAKGFPGINFKKAVDDFTTGQQTPDVLKALANPQAMQLFTQMVGYKKQQEQIDAASKRQESQQNAYMDRLFAREDKVNEKKAMDEGTNFFKKYGVGSPQTWAQYLSDPSTQQTVENLVKNPALAGKDPHLRSLLDIGTRLQQDNDLHISSTVRQNLMAADNVLRNIKAKKVDQTLGLQQATDLLNQNAQLRGTRQILLTTADKVPGTNSLLGFLSRNKIVAVDPVTHEKIDVGDDINAIDKFASKPSSANYSPQQIMQASQLVQSAKSNPITMKQVVDKLKKEHPEVYKILQQRGDIPNSDTADSPNPNIR